MENTQKNIAVFNGIEVKYIDTGRYIAISKSDLENKKKIEGVVAYAHYCPSNSFKTKWKVEFRKGFAKVCGIKEFIKHFEKRDQAKALINSIDKSLKLTKL